MRLSQVVLCLGALASMPVYAQQLFHPVADPVQPVPAIAEPFSGEPRLRARQVTLNSAYFVEQATAPESAAPELVLNLFPDVTLHSKREVVQMNGQAYMWRGTVEGASGWGRAVIAVYGDQLVGLVQYDGQLFLIRPITTQVAIVVEVRQKSFQKEAFPIPNINVPREPLPGIPDGSSVLKVMLVLDSSLSSICTLPWLDVLYEAIFEANLNDVWDTFTADDITADVVLYCTSHSAAGGDLTADLNWVATDAVIANERDAQDADLVSYIVPNGGFCGRGYYNPPPVVAADESTAFSVTIDDCALTNYSLAHEIGHNLGMQHNREEMAGGDPAECNYGYLITWNNAPYLRSAMAYDCAAGGCDRIGSYSYPFTLPIPPFGDIVYGEACGTATAANNVQQLEAAAPVAEGFR